MSLITGRQVQQFQQALLSAFPSKAKLMQMVSFELDWQLDAIAGGQNLTEIVFNLIQHAQAEGSTDKLLAAALSQNPGNPTLDTFAQKLGYRTEGQSNLAKQYLQTTLKKLTQNGATRVASNQDSQNLELIAQITDFEPGLGMRGDAFFLFSTFDTITLSGLRSYSAHCLNIAKGYPASSLSNALWNVRIPSRFCFVIAIVQQLDSSTETTIRNSNLFQDAVDTFWYKIPAVFDLSQQKLIYYEDPDNLLSYFQGEMVWKKLRETIRQLLDN